MAYGKIHESFWSDDKIVSLPDDAKLLAVYLITGPHRSAVGAMRLPIGYIVEDLRWTIPKCKAAIKELEAIGFIVRDDASGWTHVRNQIKYDPPQNDNQLKAAIKAARNIPIPGIFASVRECSARHTRDLGKGIATAFEGLANGFETVGECSPPPSACLHPPSAVPQPLPLGYGQSRTDVRAPPVDEAVALWNTQAETLGLPKVEKLTDQRRNLLKARLLSTGGIAGWSRALGKVRDSPFLRGESNGNGHERWRCTFDFLIRESSYQKIVEGHYDDHDAMDSERLKREVDVILAREGLQ